MERNVFKAGGSNQDPAACACDVSSIRAHFDDKAAHAGSGPASLHTTTRALLDLLGDPRGQRVLDLGCGRGGFLASVLRGGASAATGIDVSPASLDAARRQLADAGVADRATLREGDGAAVDLDAHDWVVLDRVICCYPDADTLVAHSAAAALGRYAFSVPASRGWRGRLARVSWAAENVYDRFRTHRCRGFVHDLDRVEGTLARLGFERRAQTYRGLWYIALFERTAAAVPAPG